MNKAGGKTVISPEYSGASGERGVFMSCSKTSDVTEQSTRSGALELDLRDGCVDDEDNE